MSAFDIIITFAVLLGIFVLGYCAITKQKLKDLLIDLRDFIKGGSEIPVAPQGYIR